MSWHRSTILQPAPQQLGAAAGAAAAALASQAPILAAAQAAVASAAAHYTATQDQLQHAADGLLTSASNLVNDTFGFGVYNLTVTGETLGEIGLRSRYDITGIPIMTPKQGIFTAI